MKIPKTLKIGNVTYTVGNLQTDNAKRMGSSHCQEQSIKIKDSLSKDKKEETFIHEIVHQILDIADFEQESDDEKLVTCIANGVYQVFKENGFLKDE